MPIWTASARICLDANRRDKAEKVLNWLPDPFRTASRKTEAYHKGGFMAALVLPIPAPAWPEVVCDFIATAQLLSSHWTMSGLVHDEVGLVTSDFRVVGVSWAHLSLDRTTAGHERAKEDRGCI